MDGWGKGGGNNIIRIHRKEEVGYKSKDSIGREYSQKVEVICWCVSHVKRKICAAWNTVIT